MSCMYRRGPGIIGPAMAARKRNAYFVQCAGSCVSLRPGIDSSNDLNDRLKRYETRLCRMRDSCPAVARPAPAAARTAPDPRASASAVGSRNTICNEYRRLYILITVQGPRRRGGGSTHSVYSGSCHAATNARCSPRVAHASSADLSQLKARSHNADRSDADSNRQTPPPEWCPFGIASAHQSARLPLQPLTQPPCAPHTLEATRMSCWAAPPTAPS